MLLDVPAHGDLLSNQDHEDETERGRQLVTSHTSWRVEMALWIKKVQDAEEDVEMHQENPTCDLAYLTFILSRIK